MSNEFKRIANEMNLHTDAAYCVGDWAMKNQVDLNSVKVFDGPDGVEVIVEIGERKTGKFIVLTDSVAVTTVALYIKEGPKVILDQATSF